MNLDHEHLINAYEAASKKIRDPKKSAGHEAEFMIAYQNLVKAGIALQIKKKYR